jgi:hypothetical protein
LHHSFDTSNNLSAALAASQHLTPKVKRQVGAVLVAGGGGKLGGEVVRRLVASVSLGRYRHVALMATEDFHAAMAGVQVLPVSATVENWPPLQPKEPKNQIQTAVVMFEPPRMFYARERTIWTPHPSELPALAKWLHASGIRHLVVVLPHQPGMLPAALQQGLASLDEQMVTTLGFERVIFMRMAQTDIAVKTGNHLERLANWMLGIGKYMIPANQTPLRTAQIAKLVEQVLQIAPAGNFVIPPSGELPKAWGLGELVD